MNGHNGYIKKFHYQNEIYFEEDSNPYFENEDRNELLDYEEFDD